jgi:hypothetical protein
MDLGKIRTETDSVLSHVAYLKQTAPDDGAHAHPSPELYTAFLLEALLEERNTAWEAINTFHAIKNWLVTKEEMELHIKAMKMSGQIIRHIKSEQQQATKEKE